MADNDAVMADPADPRTFIRTLPPRNNASTSYETPRVYRHINSVSFHSSGLKEARQAVVKDVIEIPVVTVDFFLQSALPEIDQDEFGKIMDLMRKESPGGIRDDGKLMVFSGALSASGKTESGAFRPLKPVFDAIVRCAAKVHPDGRRRATLDLKYKPNATPTSFKDNNSRPDFYLSLVDGDEALKSTGAQEPWEDIPLAGEVTKLLDNETEHTLNEISRPRFLTLPLQNDVKIIRAGYHMLRNDPRRQFVFGITFDDTQARLWFFCRAHIMVSERFDFTVDHHHLIHFIYALAYAKPEQLGYDTSMTRILVEEKIQYLIYVGDKCYQTVRPLSDFKADVIQGRATRVWEVLEVKNGKTGKDSHVLKDFWLDLDATSEGLREQAEKDEADKAIFEQHFVKFLHGACVRDGTGQDVDVSAKRFVRNHDLESNRSHNILSLEPEKRSSTRHVHIGATHPTSVGNEAVTLLSHRPDSELPELPPGPKRYNPRSHQRSVFNLVHSAYHDLEDLSIMTRTLRDIVKALKLLWNFGYVHRDINIGNIFWDDVNEVGRLSDIEFVKKTSDTTSHDVKAGTAEFMAVEVHLQRYLFEPPPPKLDSAALFAACRSRKAKVEFRFNPLHDLESIWWIALWTFLHFTPTDVSDSQLMKQYHIARTLFSGDRDRNECFRSPEDFKRHLDALAFDPETVMGRLGLEVDVLAFALRREYVKVESELPIQTSKFDGVYDRLNDVMEDMVTSISESVHNVVPLRNKITSKLSEKRKSRDDDGKTVQEEAPGRKKPRRNPPSGQ